MCLRFHIHKINKCINSILQKQDTLNWSLYYICHSAEVLSSNPSRVGCSSSGSVHISHAFNELIEYVESHRGSGAVLSMADLTLMYAYNK